MSRPPLSRTESQRARDMAFAKLEGGPSPAPRATLSPPIESSFVPEGAPPRLSALQRRHLAQQQQQQQEDNDATSEVESPSYSVFAPSVVNVERQEARSNLIRKLSKRDNNPSPTQEPPNAGQLQLGFRFGGRSGIQTSRADVAEEETDEMESLAPRSRTSVVTNTGSEFRAYRHTYERDRDSAYAKLMQEDHFEYESLLARKASIKAQKEREEQQKAASLKGSDNSAFISPDPSYQFPSPQMSDPHDRALQKYTASVRPKSQLPGATNKGVLQSSNENLATGVASGPKHRGNPEASNRHTPSAPQRQSRHRSSIDHGHKTAFSQIKSSSSPRHSLTPSQTKHSRSSSKKSVSEEPESSSAWHDSTTRDAGATWTSVAKFSSHRPNQSYGSYGGSSNEGIPSPVHSDIFEEAEEPTSPLLKPTPLGEPPRDVILKQLSSLLGSDNVTRHPFGGPSTTSLETPPRKLLLHAPILQVVNANTIKDRYLFLFSDVLVIAKPLIVEDHASGLIIPPTLDSRFLVKSIVELDKLRLTTHREEEAVPSEDATQRKKQSLLSSFVDRFANDPKKAIAALVSKGGLANEPAVIANLLFRTAELNRSKLGAYLCKTDNKQVLKAYCDRFRLTGIRIEDGLRLFLSTLRLPNDSAAAEYLISVFASVYLYSNPQISMSPSLCTKLVISIMELNDYLHSGSLEDDQVTGNLFGFSNPSINTHDFISAFRSKDPKVQVTDEALTRIYVSIRKERLQQAADNSIGGMTPDIPITLSPSRLPTRLTYRTSSNEITLTLPKTEPRFQIRLLTGPDIICEPSFLSFAKQKEQSFRITGTGLGHKSISFLKMGPMASFYSGLPVNKTFSIERAFMKHTFQLAFINHLGVKRKYMFSMSDGELRDQWLAALRSATRRTAATNQELSTSSRATSVANVVALQVLRDSLLAPDEPPEAQPNASSRPNSRSGTPRSGHARSNSFSRTYTLGIGRAEANLVNGSQSLRSGTAGLLAGDKRPSNSPNPSSRQPSNSKPATVEDAATVHAMTGQELVTTVCQNSHLPAVLGLLNAHVSVAPHPLDNNATAFRPPLQPLTHLPQ